MKTLQLQSFRNSNTIMSEIRILKKVNSPYLIGLEDEIFNPFPEVLCIVIEYCEV